MSTIRPTGLPVTAQSLTTPVTPRNIQDVAATIAGETVSLSSVLPGAQRRQIAADAATLRQRLVLLLPNVQGHTSIMLAGSLLAGPHALVLPDLSQALHSAAHKPAEASALAEQIKSIQAPVHGPEGRSVALLNSLSSHTTGALLREDVGAQDIAGGMFLSGAFARHYDHLGVDDQAAL